MAAVQCSGRNVYDRIVRCRWVVLDKRKTPRINLGAKYNPARRTGLVRAGQVWNDELRLQRRPFGLLAMTPHNKLRG